MPRCCLFRSYEAPFKVKELLEANVIFLLCYDEIDLRRLACNLANEIDLLGMEMGVPSSNFSLTERLAPLR